MGIRWQRIRHQLVNNQDTITSKETAYLEHLHILVDATKAMYVI